MGANRHCETVWYVDDYTHCDFGHSTFERSGSGVIFIISSASTACDSRKGVPALVASSIRALVSRRDTTDLERPTKRAPSDRGSAVSLVISEKRAELLKVKEQRLQAELELLEQQQIAEQDLEGCEDGPRTPNQPIAANEFATPTGGASEDRGQALDFSIELPPGLGGYPIVVLVGPLME